MTVREGEAVRVVGFGIVGKRALHGVNCIHGDMAMGIYSIETMHV